jgi:hypothetical protein
MPLDAGRGADLDTFKAGWKCPAILSSVEWEEALRAHGLRVQVDRDLTADCRPRSLETIAFLERVNRLAQRIVPVRGLRDVLRSHQGGLALERLLQTGGMRYRMLVTRLD